MDTALMFTPEVEKRLRELAEAEDRATQKTVEEAIEEYFERRQRDAWTRATARRIFEENAEFFEMLGDR